MSDCSRSRRGRAAEGTSPESNHPPRSALGEAVGTLALLIVLYSPFDHNLRHLIVVLPILAWELSLAGAGLPTRFERLGTIGSGLGLAAAAVAVTMLFPCRLPGWETAAADAARLRPAVETATAEVRTAPPGVVFVEYSAVPWFADRPGVWSPLDQEVAGRISGMLAEDSVPRP